MLKFAFRFTKAFAVLLLTMVGYSLTVVPAIEPPERDADPIPPFTQYLSNDQWWTDFFEPGSWQTNQPRVIYTDKGILLSHDWHPINAKTWELKPLTIILPQTSEAREAVQDRQADVMAQQDMWIVSAEEGATIHFEEAFEPFGATAGTMPTIVRGDLSGAIEITRKAAVEVDKQPWKLRTYDLSIDRRQFSTQKAVHINWGDSVIEGRALKILLTGNLLGSQGSKSNRWGPLDELELYHVDKIDIGLPTGGIWANLSPQDTDSVAAQNLANLPARLLATCGGRFAFDFKSSVATLQNGVLLRHQLGQPGTAAFAEDQFLCDFISLDIEPPQKSASNQSTSASTARMQVNGFEALGVDSIQNFVGEKWVEVAAPTVGVTARAKRLKVDLLKRRIEFDGRIDRPGATQSLVNLNYKGHEFQSPKIEYQAAPERSGGEPGARHLGWMYAAGPGELKADLSANSSAAPGKTHVRWQKSLKMTPAPESEQTQWIELDGNTLVESKQHGLLASNRLEIWLTEQADEDLISALPLANGTGQGNSATSANDRRYLPTRIYAAGKTILSTPSIEAHVTELDLGIVYAPSITKAVEPEQAGLTMNDAQGNPMYQWVTPPAPPATALSESNSNASNALQGSRAASDPRLSEPVSVTGRSLAAQIVSAGDASWIDQLQIDGPVKVWKPRSTRDNSLPWHIEGDQLLLATNRAGQADMQIDGAPAKIIVAEGSLNGPSIRFDQSKNLVWMDHPGEFEIPISALNEPSSSVNSTTTSASEIQWLRPPHCVWGGRMVFDGQLATIQGDVVFDAALRTQANQLWMVKGWSQRLTLTLSDAVELQTSSSSDAPRVEIERVSLAEDVTILASEVDAEGNKLSRERIAVPELTFHVLQSQVVAQGPGWITSNFESSGGLGQLAGSRSSPAAGKTELRGAHLLFRDSMVAFMDRKEVVFDGKVELGTGLIPSWDDYIDVHRMQTLRNDQALLTCDQLKVYDTSALSTIAVLRDATSKEPWEFQATGNVAFNGMAEDAEYAGTGYQITYAQAKERLLLRGDARSPAFVQKSPKLAGEKALQGYVDEVAINPRTGAIEILKTGQGGFEVSDSTGLQPTFQPFAPGGANLPPAAGVPNPRQDFYKRN